MYTVASTRSWLWSMALGLVAIVPMAARAQNPPVRLPGMSTTETKLPGPKILTGIVRDTGNVPVIGAEIMIPSLHKRFYSNDSGGFRFIDVPPGVYQVQARKIGYAMQTREFYVGDGGGLAEFQLLPQPRELPAIVSASDRLGLSGTVADTAFGVIPGAQVRVLAKGMQAVTDSGGAFYLPVPPGNYMVSIRRDGFKDKMVSVSIPNDSGRRITAWMRPWEADPPVDEYWNVADLNERQAWISKNRSTLFTREQLVKKKIEWLYEAVQMTGSKLNAKELFDRDCFATVNGGPAIASMATISIDDIESVEVYPALGLQPGQRPGNDASAAEMLGVGTRGTRGVVSIGGGRAPVGVTNTSRQASNNQVRHCPLVYVWLR